MSNRKLIYLLPFLIIASILVITLIISFQSNVSKEIQNKELNASFPQLAFEQELDKIKNPVTGLVPGNAIYQAYQQLLVQGKIRKSDIEAKKLYVKGWKPYDDYLSNLCISKLTFDPNNTKVYYFCTGEGWFNADAGRGAGVWKSTDAGNSWFQLESTNTSTFHYCQDLVVHPSTSHIYVSTRNGGLQRSVDGGQNWQQVLGTASGTKSNRAADIELTIEGGVFVSMGIFEKDGIYYSESGDSGTFESRMYGFPSAVYRIEIATAPSNDQVVYAVPTSSISVDKHLIVGFYRSFDKGLNWEETENPGGERKLAKNQGWYDLIIEVDPNNENVVIAGGLDLWRTQDAGDHWQKLSSGKRRNDNYVHVDQHEIIFQNSDTVYFGNDGGIWRSDNFTVDSPLIYNLNNTYNVTQFYAAAIHPEPGNRKIIGGTQDNGSLMVLDKGISDFKTISGADGSFCCINPHDGDIIYTTTQYRRMYRYVDGGEGIPDTITNDFLENDDVLFINPIEIDPVNPEIIYQASSLGLWRLTNASNASKEDWKKASYNWGDISAIGVSKDVAHHVFLGRRNGGKIYRLDDADESDETKRPVWLNPDFELPNAYCSNIYVDPEDANHLIVIFSNYGINNIWECQHALSDSAKWTNHDGDLPDLPVRWALLHPAIKGACYIATELGIFYTWKLNGGETVWEPMFSGIPLTRVDMLRLRNSDHTVVAATHGRGLFTGTLKNNAMSINWTERGPQNVGGRTRTIMVDPNVKSNKKLWAGSVSGGLFVINDIDSIDYYIPDEKSTFKLKIMTNPINQQGSWLDIELGSQQNIHIQLYDISGQQMETIVDNKIFVGAHRIKWTPKIPYRPGIYFISMKGETKALIRKVLIY
ncbi:MAG: T9SS type A sorting domain-containing protein [Bacteroidetes bacterium]|nr:T9SS type A sorting domain-containing protein [Bacteroidota bacterium]